MRARRFALFLAVGALAAAAATTGCGHWQVNTHYVIRHSPEGEKLDIKEVTVSDGDEGYTIYACDQLRSSHSNIGFESERAASKFLDSIGCRQVGTQPASDGTMPKSLTSRPSTRGGGGSRNDD